MWFTILTGAALKSTAVLAAAWLAARALRRHSAASRHLVWTAALAAILLLPLLSLALPALRVPVPAAAAVVFETGAAPPAPSATPRVSVPAGAPAATHPAPWRPDARTWLLLLWAAGAAVAFARMLAACAVAWRVRRAAGPFPDRDLCASLAKALGIRRAVDVRLIRSGSMPMTFGLRQSAVLMPADAGQWDRERRRMVLLHELAHVRRGDAATHLLGRVAVALYWWNPLAWTAWRQFLKERERAADDLVLSAGVRASDYAGHLLEIARTLRPAPVAAWAATAFARRSQLEGRLLAILDSGVNRAAPDRAAVLAAAVLAIAMIAPLAAVRAQDDQPAAVPTDVDATIRAAQSQNNYESLEAAAHAAMQSAKYDVAQKLLDAALSMRAQVSGEQSADYAVGLLKLAELHDQKSPNSAGDLYARAARILGDRPEAARALIHLGVAAAAKKDFTAATDYFDRAQHAAPAQAPAALMWKAIVQRQQKNFEEADRLFQSALVSQDPTVMRVYARFLREQDRAGQARDFEDRADAIEKSVAPPALHPGVYRVGKTIAPPSILHKVEPKYSEEARIAGLQGAVVLQVVVAPDGLPRHVHVIRELGLGLDENAIEAINQWQFKPGMKDGQPVPVAATIEVNFRLF